MVSSKAIPIRSILQGGVFFSIGQARSVFSPRPPTAPSAASPGVPWDPLAWEFWPAWSPQRRVSSDGPCVVKSRSLSHATIRKPQNHKPSILTAPNEDGGGTTSLLVPSVTWPPRNPFHRQRMDVSAEGHALPWPQEKGDKGSALYVPDTRSGREEGRSGDRPSSD